MRRIQGWYYFLGGVWPLIHWRSFTAIAGPKPDRFQTEITAGLFTAIGYALLRNDDQSLAAASAMACIGMDRKFAGKIRLVFQADALLNAIFLLSALRRRKSLLSQ